MERTKVSAEELLSWKRKLDALRTDCGCRAGEIVLVPSMAAYAYYYLWAHGGTYTVRHKIAAGCIVFFASAVVGKLAGLVVARLRCRALERKYLAALNDARAAERAPES